MADSAEKIGSKPITFAKFPLILSPLFIAGEIFSKLIRGSLKNMAAVPPTKKYAIISDEGKPRHLRYRSTATHREMSDE